MLTPHLQKPLGQLHQDAALQRLCSCRADVNLALGEGTQLASSQMELVPQSTYCVFSAACGTEEHRCLSSGQLLATEPCWLLKSSFLMLSPAVQEDTSINCSAPPEQIQGSNWVAMVSLVKGYAWLCRWKYLGNYGQDISQTELPGFRLETVLMILMSGTKSDTLFCLRGDE